MDTTVLFLVEATSALDIDMSLTFLFSPKQKEYHFSILGRFLILHSIFPLMTLPYTNDITCLSPRVFM